MEASDKGMDKSSIIKEFDGLKYTEDIGRFLESQDIMFEVIDGLVCIKSKPVEHDMAKNILNSLILKELSIKGLDCESLIESRHLRGDQFAEDFLIPDICVINLDDSRYGPNGMLVGIPKLVVEVLSSNRNDDLYKKRLIYQEMKVPEYWIVDLDGYSIMQLILEDDKYNKRPITFLGGKIRHHICGLEVDVDELFSLLKKKLDRLKRSSTGTTSMFS